MISSLNHIPEEINDGQQYQPTVAGSSFFNFNGTEKTIEQNIMQQKPTLNIIEETSQSYLKRGGLNSDRLLMLVRSANKFKLNEKDQMLLDILKQDIIDLKHEENQNVAIYILRKKLKNDLETTFLNNVIKNLPFFSSSSVQEAKDNAQFKRIVNAVMHRHVSKYQVIFKHGSVFCLIPDPNYKKQDQPKGKTSNIKLIEKKENETKAESTARSFLNTLAESLNKKNKVESNVLSFVDIIRSQAKRKMKQPAKQLIRSTTKQLEDMFEEEEKINDNLTDTEFLKQQYPGYILVKTFMPGESFGEIALLTSQNRTATLVSREESDFMVLNKEGFDKTMGLLKKNAIREKIEFIKSFEFFSNLCTKKFKIIKVNVRQNIYEEGDNSNFFFLIKEGEVELQSRYSNPQELVKQYSIEKNEQEKEDLNDLRKKKTKINVNQLHTVKILGQNSYFGEEEIVKNIPKREGKAICRGQDSEIFAIEKKRLHGVLGYTIFDKFKESVDFKEEMKSQRLKNVIKMKIPQNDIENLNEFLENDKKKKEFEIQREQIKQELSKKLKMNFSKRYNPQSEQDKSNIDKKDNESNINDISDDISDGDVQEYNRQKNLDLQKKTFFKIHDKLTQIQKSAVDHTPQNNNVNLVTPIFPLKETRKSFRFTQVQTLDDYKMNNELKSITQIKQPTSNLLDVNTNIRRTSKMALAIDNSLDDYIAQSARTLQIKSFTTLLEIEDKDEQGQETPLDNTKQNQTKNLPLLQNQNVNFELKDKVYNKRMSLQTKTDKLILNLNKNSAVQKQIQQIKDQHEQISKPKTPQLVYQDYNFQKSSTPQSTISPQQTMTPHQNMTPFQNMTPQQIMSPQQNISPRQALTPHYNIINPQPITQQNNTSLQNNLLGQTSPLKQRVLNSSKKIQRIAGNGNFNEVADATLQNNFISTPIHRQVVNTANSNQRNSNKMIRSTQTQHLFNITTGSKSQFVKQSDLSTSNILLNNSNTNTPANNINLNQSAVSASQHRYHIGTLSVPSFSLLSANQNNIQNSNRALNYNSLTTTNKQSNNNQNHDFKTNILEKDVIVEEAPISEFIEVRDIKSSNKQRRKSSLQQNGSKNTLNITRSTVAPNPVSSSTSHTTLDEKSYLIKPLSSRSIKKDIAPHKIRPITKIENRQYFNSVLQNTTQDTIFKNINISQQNLQQVKNDTTQQIGMSQTPFSRSMQQFFKIENKQPQDHNEAQRKITVEQFKKRASHLSPQTQEYHLQGQYMNAQTSNMFRFKKQIQQPNEEIDLKSIKPTTSHQQLNKTSLNAFISQQPMQNISLAVLSSKYSDNKKILF